MKVRALLMLMLVACGPTVGDPCTTASDCLGKVCLNGGGVPGGYCSVSCTLGDANSCPTGSVCIRDGVSGGTHGCFRTCASTKECRPTYLCDKVRGSGQSVCVGPNGL